MALDAFSGESDPMEHLRYFNTKMVIGGATDEAGHLANFVKDTTTPEATKITQGDKGRGKEIVEELGDPVGECSSIAGGFGGGVISSNARKRYVAAVHSVHEAYEGECWLNHSPITFIPQDFAQESDLKPYKGTLVGFTGDRVNVRGYVEIPTAFDEGDFVKKFQVKYLVLACRANYNVLLGRDTLNKLCAVISTAHLTVKYPACNGKVGVLRVDQNAARECYLRSVALYGRKAAKESHRITEIFPHEGFSLDPRDDADDFRPQPLEETKSAQIKDKVLKIGSGLTKEQEERLITLLGENLDLFAWTIDDVPGIDPNVITHKLAIRPGAKPVIQPRRRMSDEKNKAVQVETEKLIKAQFIREVQYPTWLTNLVDGASGNELLSLMDAYSGYNQIMMHPSDEESTTFMTNQANYCYKTMPFGLKNAGATYQRLMDKIFSKQVGRNMEVYVDDMIVKSARAGDHGDDLKEEFAQLRTYQMKLNPEKCSFGIQGGKFLGFMLTSRGIEVNPDKGKAILEMKSPTSVKEVQRLTGRMAALSRFLPMAGDKAAPFFTCLKKNLKFQWNEACEQAFTKLKETLATLPVLSKPTPGVPLILYLAVTDKAGAESRYQKIEKAALAILKTARRLRPYFQGFQVKVKTDVPLRQVLQKPDLSGRLVSWSVELSEYDIQYEPRGQVTIQSLIDFVAELTPAEGEKTQGEWVLSVDGSSNDTGSGAGITIESPDKMVIEQSLKFEFRASNNQSEYEALIAGLRLAIELGVQKLFIKGDSQLVVKQVKCEYQVKDPQLSKYLEVVRRLMMEVKNIRIEHVPRGQNERADVLAKLASTGRLGNYQTVIQETLPRPIIDLVEVKLKAVKSVTEGEPSWMESIKIFLENPPRDDDLNSRAKRREASFYTLIDGELYRRGIMSPMLKCVDTKDAPGIMAEVHEGVCSSHIGGRSLAVKVLRAGFYWPTMKKDCLEYVKKC
ncbi:uncharacterized protein LOC130719491 [Lotus japonicus]|uniref:uncharacterized protein LOC130719491 n=1 Tax=Lotus japonicus TaxID=34305 RepID=UPI0025890064|nr:uncharacterized protein LOC130719491 [Lotus japonicus]